MPSLPGLSLRPVRPPGIAASSPPADPVPPSVEAASDASGDSAAGGEAGSGTAFAVPVAELMAVFPRWRSLPVQDPQLHARLPAGQLPPPGGKDLPPRIPVVPIEIPAVETRGLSAGGPAGAQIAQAGADIEARLPAASVRAEPLAVLPANANGPPAESALQRAPSEVVRLPEAPGLPPAPVLAGARTPLPQPPGRYAITGPARAELRSPPGYPVSLSLDQPVGEAEVRARLATDILPERTPFADTFSTGGSSLRLAAAPDAGIASTTTIAQPAQPGAPAISFSQQHLPEMVGSEEWAEAVAQRLSQLAESPQARANIRLNPPQLGPMQIEVHVDGDRAVVQLAVHHDMTRDALEQAMPKLRAQLESSGFSSIDVSVSRNPHRERPGADQPYADASTLPEDDLPGSVTGPGPSTAVRLLDAYA